jgi:hypothetical protein
MSRRDGGSRLRTGGDHPGPWCRRGSPRRRTCRPRSSAPRGRRGGLGSRGGKTRPRSRPRRRSCSRIGGSPDLSLSCRNRWVTESGRRGSPQPPANRCPPVRGTAGCGPKGARQGERAGSGDARGWPGGRWRSVRPSTPPPGVVRRSPSIARSEVGSTPRRAVGGQVGVPRSGRGSGRSGPAAFNAARSVASSRCKVPALSGWPAAPWVRIKAVNIACTRALVNSRSSVPPR